VKPAEFKKSWGIGLRRLPHLFLALLIVSLISMAVSMTPYIGTILTLIVALMFLFVNQIIVLDGIGFYRSLLSSTKIFSSRLGPVFCTWLFATLITLLIAAVFMIPLFAVITYNIMIYGVENVSETLLADSQGLHIQFGFTIALLGMSITKVFGLKFQTAIYTQLKKKKWVFF